MKAQLNIGTITQDAALSAAPSWIRNANISSPSPLLTKVFEVLYSPTMTLEDLADIIKTDAGLASRTLRSSNAAFSCPANKITDVRDAIVRMGLTTTIHIVTATEVSSIFFSVPGKLGIMKNHWKHNLMVAAIAESIATYHHLPDPGRWFLGGLIHDIGRLMMLKVDTHKYSMAVEKHLKEEIELRDAERELFDYSHDIAGGLLLDYWQFPTDIADAAYDHHNDFKAYEDFGSGIGVANSIANAIQKNEPLPHFPNLPVSEIVIKANDRYEVMKKVAGIN